MTGPARTTMPMPMPMPRAATDDLRTALEELGRAAAGLDHDGASAAALAAAVRTLEDAAGAGLGPAEHDPVVALQRRLARASRALTRRPTAAVDVATVLVHAAALRAPASSSARRAVPAAATAAAVPVLC